MSNVKLKNFIRKNFTIYHIVGVILGLGLALLYWHLSGRNCEYVVKNNPYLVSLWGILIGYITLDFVKSALTRKKKDSE